MDNRRDIKQIIDAMKSNQPETTIIDMIKGSNYDVNMCFKYACNTGYFQVVKFLIEHRKCDPNIGTMWAMFGHHDEILQYLESFPEVIKITNIIQIKH